jgi:hypothetical protein
MNEETADRNALFTQTIDRFSKLTEEGRHCFTDRLIGNAKDNPVLMQEIECVMKRLEADPELAVCWKAAEGRLQAAA